MSNTNLTVRKGLCINSGQCSKAIPTGIKLNDAKKLKNYIIEVNIGDDFVCPECYNDLVDAPPEKPFPWWILLIALIFLGIGYGIYLFLGRTIITPGKPTVQVCDTVQLTVKTRSKTWNWKSDKENIATVNSDGIVKGVRVGNAKISIIGENDKVLKSVTIKVTTAKGSCNDGPPPPPPEMIFVEGGTFTMGCKEQTGCNSNERPPHPVTLSNFYIGKYVITQAKWEEIMGNNPSTGSTISADYPVVNVSWNDIVGTSGNSVVINGTEYFENGFIYKLNKLTGYTYRLPTEAEWEYAARGGRKSQNFMYSGSNNVGDVSVFGTTATQIVGSKQPNELGLYDMSGNVWEWCSDWLSTSYPSTQQTNPLGPEFPQDAQNRDRVIRGGSWRNAANNSRVAHRGGNWPQNRHNYIGFRVAHSMPDTSQSAN